MPHIAKHNVQDDPGDALAMSTALALGSKSMYEYSSQNLLACEQYWRLLHDSSLQELATLPASRE